jgi:hypothetical protein
MRGLPLGIGFGGADFGEFGIELVKVRTSYAVAGS